MHTFRCIHIGIHVDRVYMYCTHMSDRGYQSQYLSSSILRINSGNDVVFNLVRVHAEVLYGYDRWKLSPNKLVKAISIFGPNISPHFLLNVLAVSRNFCLIFSNSSSISLLYCSQSSSESSAVSSAADVFPDPNANSPAGLYFNSSRMPAMRSLLPFPERI